MIDFFGNSGGGSGSGSGNTVGVSESGSMVSSSSSFLLNESMNLGGPATAPTAVMLPALHIKIEKMGFQVGQRLAERYTKDRGRFQDQTEIMKFICKEFWLEVFKKQMDNLRTNRKGVYVLHDSKFRWLQKLSGSDGPNPPKDQLMKYLSFPSGILRGLLANLGLNSEVIPEPLSASSCNFTIKIKS